MDKMQKDVYFINMIRRTTYHFKSMSLRIVHGMVALVSAWPMKSLKSAFWRCYFPLEKGGHILFDNAAYDLLPGYGYIIPPYTDFTGIMENRFRKFFIHFHYEAPDVRYSPGVYPYSVDSSILNRIGEISSGSESTCQITIPQHYMFLLISQGLCSIPDDCFTRQKVDPRVKMILDVMEKKLNVSVSNSEFAEIACMTEPSMIRLFKQNLGIPPQKHHKFLRLVHACELLSYSELSIDEVAENCGFYDRSHFTRDFHEEWKFPPAAYRKNKKRLY